MKVDYVDYGEVTTPCLHWLTKANGSLDIEDMLQPAAYVHHFG